MLQLLQASSSPALSNKNAMILNLCKRLGPFNTHAGHQFNMIGSVVSVRFICSILLLLTVGKMCSARHHTLSPAEHKILQRSNRGQQSVLHFQQTEKVSHSLEGGSPTDAYVRTQATGPGSAPPNCVAKCGKCAPCKPVRVPIQPGKSARLTEYYPEAWRCQCGKKLYMP